MNCKTACLIISPRSGQNVARLTDVLAVFSAAGWKTDIALKEFGGHTLQLAKDAADAGYDLVIGYGGDGTLSQVVNGVLAAGHRRRIVGLIPGGTANVWAHETGLLEDPVQAALQLVNSEARRVDLGHVAVDSLSGPAGGKERASGGRHHFLLMAGLGVDAAVLRHVSTGLKEKIGTAAVALATATTLPSQHPFPIEIRSPGTGTKEKVLWRGEALQVIVGNTRRYGNIAEVTAEARIDDGLLDVFVFTAGTPLTTLEQIVALLLRRKAGNGRSEYFRGAHFAIQVPADVALQLDGSAVKLKDYLTAPDRTALQEAGAPDAVMVTYRFDARPRALRLAIPRAYDDALFEKASGATHARAAEALHAEPRARHARANGSGASRHYRPEQMDALLKLGRMVTVVGVGPDPERKGTHIVAGGAAERITGASRPVAVRIDHDTTLLSATGELLPSSCAAALVGGGAIVVEGKQSKRGVIRATCVVVT